MLFFLCAVTEQANTDIAAATDIYALYERMKTEIRDTTHSQHGALLVDVLFQTPIFRISHMEAGGTIPAASAHKVVQQLVASGHVRQIRQGKGRRPSLFVFPELLNIVEGKKVF